MNDNDQRRQMAKAWDAFPIGRATKSVWVVLKHGKPSGADGRDIAVDIRDAEEAGLHGFGDHVSSIAPANQYVTIPPMDGNGGKIRFSRDFASVVSNSYSAHLARMVEVNMRDSDIPLDMALSLVLRASMELVNENLGLGRKALAQKVIMGGSYQLLLNALNHSAAYRDDLASGRIVKDDLRMLRCHVSRDPEVAVSTTSGGQKTYSLSLDELSLNSIHGEMSGLVSDSPLVPSLNFPLLSANYSVMFLRERNEVIIDVQWASDENRADDWSDKLVFR